MGRDERGIGKGLNVQSPPRVTILHTIESQIRVKATYGSLTQELKIHQHKGDIIHPNQPISTQLPYFKQRKIYPL